MQPVWESPGSPTTVSNTVALRSTTVAQTAVAPDGYLTAQSNVSLDRYTYIRTRSDKVKVFQTARFRRGDLEGFHRATAASRHPAPHTAALTPVIRSGALVQDPIPPKRNSFRWSRPQGNR